jgi:hypothetical protein
MDSTTPSSAVLGRHMQGRWALCGSSNCVLVAMHLGDLYTA